jgi:hypothetical protein
MLAALFGVIGSVVGGSFVLVALVWQFRRQNRAALQALMIEVENNAEIAEQMIADRGTGRFPDGRPDPGWLKHAIWDSQLPFLVQILDKLTITAVVEAYGTLEPIPRMLVQVEVPIGIPIQQPHYNRGGWIEAQIDRIHTSFHAAEGALRDLENQMMSESWEHRCWVGLEKMRQRLPGTRSR